MAWFSTLAAVALAAGGASAWAVVRRKQRRTAPPSQPVTAPPSEPTEPERIVNLSEALALADEAERAGDCERAAELFESAGMFQRAIALYRQSGNIQQAAALELATVHLGRVANQVSSAALLPVTLSGEAPSKAPSEPRVDTNWGEEDDEDRTRIHDSAALAAKLEQALEPARSARERASRWPTLADGDAPMSSETPVPMSVPPRVKSERPRGPTVEELTRMLGASPTPDLGNIEIYYRLGLAYLSQNQRDEARRAFMTVEDISPCYRDANAYLEQLAPPIEERVRSPRGVENDVLPRKRPDSGVHRGARGVVEERRVSGRRDDR